MPPPRATRRIALRLFFAVGLPASVVVLGLGLLSWRTTRNAVEASLRRELAASVAVAAGTLNPTGARVVLPGEEATSRTYKRLVARLKGIQTSTGSVRVLIIDGDERVRVDGDAQLPVGAPAPRVALDRAELKRALAGTPAVSVPFTGADGRRYMAAYAAIPEPKDDARELRDEAADADVGAPLVLVMEAPAVALDATFEVARQLGGLVALAVLVVVTLALVVARTITAPLFRLATAAQQLARGDLSTPLPVQAPQAGDDEVSALGHTLESMRTALIDRDVERQMMLAGIAHEVRNPLGGMELFSGLLKEGIAELPPAVSAEARAELDGHVSRVRGELRYLTEVVNSFLAFARDTALVKERVDVRALLLDVASLSQRAGSAPVLVEAPPDLFWELDRGRIKQALLNLVENARAATDAAGSVAISARVDDDALILAVTDTGKGMDAATLARVFTPFFTTKEKGSGLGLALVRKLARDHGGTATATSTVGAGTVVTLRLPQTPALG